MTSLRTIMDVASRQLSATGIDCILIGGSSLSQNVPRRMGKDLPDITYLSVLHNLDLESDIRSLCSRFGTPEVYELIRGQVEALRAL